jgi:hypothetical protein
MIRVSSDNVDDAIELGYACTMHAEASTPCTAATPGNESRRQFYT